MSESTANNRPKPGRLRMTLLRNYNQPTPISFMDRQAALNSSNKPVAKPASHFSKMVSKPDAETPTSATRLTAPSPQDDDISPV